MLYEVITTQMQITLGKGDLDFCFPEPAVNLLVNFAADHQPVIRIQHPDAKLEVKRSYNFV